jgi:hypothetical protein
MYGCDTSYELVVSIYPHFRGIVSKNRTTYTRWIELTISQNNTLHITFKEECCDEQIGMYVRLLTHKVVLSGQIKGESGWSVVFSNIIKREITGNAAKDVILRAWQACSLYDELMELWFTDHQQNVRAYKAQELTREMAAAHYPEGH